MQWRNSRPPVWILDPTRILPPARTTSLTLDGEGRGGTSLDMCQARSTPPPVDFVGGGDLRQSRCPPNTIAVIRVVALRAGAPCRPRAPATVLLATSLTHRHAAAPDKQRV